MKIWIGTDAVGCLSFRRVYFPKPKDWYSTIEIWSGHSTIVCRKVLVKLLHGTGLKLPRHSSKELVEVEITAKKPGRSK